MCLLLKKLLEGIDSDRELTYSHALWVSGTYSYRFSVKVTQTPKSTATLRLNLKALQMI